ncbi:MAG TPA: hypothetical protein VJ553_06275 [Candidatus Paceibacterota bacterium]|nr:hypothetical protein [Candidatus Paceibacterota bacterium]
MMLFLETLKRTETVHGTAWNAGTLRYYKPRMATMLAKPPRGAEQTAESLRKRLRKV